jgi:hypothetical protein
LRIAEQLYTPVSGSCLFYICQSAALFILCTCIYVFALFLCHVDPLIGNKEFLVLVNLIRLCYIATDLFSYCLMYADDIVILSISHAGLQNKLHQLEKYCDAWCLKVNNKKKPKIIVFNNAGRKILENFKFQNYDIECVSNYKYLGIHFTASGSFHFAQAELCKKALKAYYKLRKDFFSLNPSVKSSIHIFDHTLSHRIWYCFAVD